MSNAVPLPGLPESAQPDDLRDDPVATCSWLGARGLGRTHVDEPDANPVCERRKRSSEAEGAEGLSGDSMSPCRFVGERTCRAPMISSRGFFPARRNKVDPRPKYMGSVIGFW